MTLGEITLILKTFRDKEEQRAKEQTAIMYNQSVMIADFVSLRFNGKDLPSYQELFPSEEQKEVNKEVEYKKAMLLKEQFMFYAKEHNKRRRKQMGGDGL